MQTSEKELMREAKETGFRPEIMEKVWHLMAILDGISVHPFLKERLVLKGGTALNLFFFDLPRLSVDIDLNYIGQLDRQEMLPRASRGGKSFRGCISTRGLEYSTYSRKIRRGKVATALCKCTRREWQSRSRSKLHV
jgi:predicted nucleotidyltransferase component of viral defense system